MPGGDFDFRRSSCSRVILKMFTAVSVVDGSWVLGGGLGGGEDTGCGGGDIMEGAGWYSMWGKEGVGGSRDRRRVRSMKGGMLIPRPRATSDHELMKWSPDAPSAAWCCMPTPKEAPPHLKCVTCE